VALGCDHGGGNAAAATVADFKNARLFMSINVLRIAHR
jgi:hypothetical protein